MSLLAPLYLVAAAALSAVVVALHLIVTREPRAAALPTARFAPNRMLPARPTAARLRDALLLALRVSILLAVGLALAHPVFTPRRRALARVVLLDRSTATANPAEAADSARSLLGDDDALVVFDTTAIAVRRDAIDSLGSVSSLPDESNLSAALVAGMRAAQTLRDEADSVELAIVAPFARGSFDHATDSIRALWPGAVRLVPVGLRARDASVATVAMDAPDDDPLRFAFTAPLVPESIAAVRVVRGAATASDSSWARSAGRTLVHWPVVAAGSSAQADTVGAVVTRDVVVVVPFVRRGRASAATDTTQRVVARWVDGVPAAVERSFGAGCVRVVTIDVPSVGDLVLQPRFARLVSSLAAPCGARPADVALDEQRLPGLRGAGSTRVASSTLPRRRELPPSPAPWLIALAAVLAVAEWRVRRGPSAEVVPA